MSEELIVLIAIGVIQILGMWLDDQNRVVNLWRSIVTWFMNMKPRKFRR